MTKLLENPLVPQGAKGTPEWMARARTSGILAGLFAWGVFLLWTLGVCADTVFALTTAVMVLATTFGIGNTAFGALTGERERKTLDSLRLTQLSAHEVLFGKLVPEFWTLVVLLFFTAPPVLAAGWVAGFGVGTPFAVVVVGAMGGVFAAVSAVFLSSLFATTSQAVVAGWILKVLWLLATPLLDMVVGAVLVQHVSPPIFSSVNPIAASGVLLIPEGASGSRALIPILYPLMTLFAIAVMWLWAAHRFATGMVSGGGLKDRVVHPVYKKGWGPQWLSRAVPVLRTNPAFLRELAAQVRSGAGRWPGFMVFLVLFLAPTFYARSWSMTEMGRAHFDRSRRPVTVTSVPAPEVKQAVENDTHASGGSKVYLRTYTGTEVVLEGHTTTCCLRMFLFDVANIPLPKDSLRFYRTSYTSGDLAENYGSPDTYARATRLDVPDPATATALGLENRYVSRELSNESRAALNQSSVSVGLAGAIALFLLYLAIRYSAFMATAVTGERSRRTWEDMALTGMSPREFIQGKTMGAILLPWVQMTLAFPVLLLFVAHGNLSVFEVGGLYLYAVTLTGAAAMLGLWSSATASTSHDAHLRALGVVLASFFVLPMTLSVVSPLLVAIALVACLGAAVNGRSTVSAWGGVALALAMAPQAASPLTAAVSFMPSLTMSQSFLTLLGVAPATPGAAVMNFMCGLLLMGSLGLLFWRATLARLGGATEDAGLAASDPAAELATA
ncbi:MAG: hypothetical protein FJX76_14035 [Armatimonadetes bacterium]|nr:hypothetical protein [Armatimonadota bacterium]